jgi:hypothetical protein
MRPLERLHRYIVQQGSREAGHTCILDTHGRAEKSLAAIPVRDLLRQLLLTLLPAFLKDLCNAVIHFLKIIMAFKTF